MNNTYFELAGGVFEMTADLRDRFNRPIHDLRVSVTDRCNFRCVYCMPKEIFNKQYKFLPRKELLTFEEIERVVRVYAQYGVSKIRITGGEPLVRSDLEKLIGKDRSSLTALTILV